MSFNITPVARGYQEIHPYSAMNIDSVKINTSLIMMKECDIHFVLPSAFDILRYILSCRAIAIYDLPINLRYIFKRVSPLATILTSSEREIRSENALSRPEEHSFDLLTEIVADEDGCFYMNPFRSLIIFLSHFKFQLTVLAFIEDLGWGTTLMFCSQGNRRIQSLWTIFSHYGHLHHGWENMLDSEHCLDC